MTGPRRGRGEEEPEFFIQEAIGWVLRETGKKRPERVHECLLPRASGASGLTVREAVKYLPDSMMDEILGAWGAASSGTGGAGEGAGQRGRGRRKQ